MNFKVEKISEKHPTEIAAHYRETDNCTWSEDSHTETHLSSTIDLAVTSGHGYIYSYMHDYI